MSDPRASIARTVLAPPVPVAASPSTERPGPGAVVEDVNLIGKAHGRMRCVNLSLTPEAKEALYCRAEAGGVTLGEAFMDLVAQAAVAARPRRPDRAATMRRGVQTVSVFVLLTHGEAREIVSKAEAAGRTVSDFASDAATH